MIIMLTDPGVRDGPFLFLSSFLVDRPHERFLSWLIGPWCAGQFACGGRSGLT